MAELREKLGNMDQRFALVGIKMYFVHVSGIQFYLS